MNIKINSFEKIRWTKVWKNERVEKETDSFENLVDSQNVHQPMISAKGQKKKQFRLNKQNMFCSFFRDKKIWKKEETVQIQQREQELISTSLIKEIRTVEQCFVHVRNYPKYVNVENGNKRRKNETNKQIS